LLLFLDVALSGEAQRTVAAGQEKDAGNGRRCTGWRRKRTNSRGQARINGYRLRWSGKGWRRGEEEDGE
jgi:hypothetical protein